MKRILALVLIGILAMSLFGGNSAVHAEVSTLPNHDYVDFSSDRSTWFFDTKADEGNKAFFDFFLPFDSTVKISTYNPLVMYEFDHDYHYTDDGVLMVHLEDLRKMYAPYFDYVRDGDTLLIRHTIYDKFIKSGFGRRGTTIEYTKKVWDMTIDLSGETLSGSYDYSQYEPTTGGRNLPAIGSTDIDFVDEKVGFMIVSGAVTEGDDLYLPIADIMDLMGKKIFEEDGYLAIQGEDMADVTVEIERDEEVPAVVVPRPTNVWYGGSVEEADEDYTWAHYMDDVASGARTTGWLWRAFYIPSGTFLDGNGEEHELAAERIVPYNLYVPSGYNKNTSRMVHMLHGGTGNEHTATYRIIERGMPVDQYAEDYNYVMVSPNGWTQDPLWRQDHALYSFLKAAELAMEEFPVDEDKVFITGNSMGGKGTLEIAVRYPEMFRAMAPTSVKIAKRNPDRSIGINIDDTVYTLESVADMPAFLAQGTADTTTSFKVQIGNNVEDGVVKWGVMPYLNDATYVSVENGHHSYSYGSVLIPIFDFFESTFGNGNNRNEVVRLTADEKMVKVGGKSEVSEDTLMVSLGDLERILGDAFKAYPVEAYNRDPEVVVNYWTIIYGNQSMNIYPSGLFEEGEGFNHEAEVDNDDYRINMDRFKADVHHDLIEANRDDLDKLDHHTEFSVAPFENDGEVYVPVIEFLEAFGVDVELGKSVSAGH